VVESEISRHKIHNARPYWYTVWGRFNRIGLKVMSEQKSNVYCMLSRVSLGTRSDIDQFALARPNVDPRFFHHSSYGCILYCIDGVSDIHSEKSKFVTKWILQAAPD